jgi:phosphoglucosamine mutase
VCHRFEALPQILKNVKYKNARPLENASVQSAIASAEERLGRTGRLIIRASGTEPVIRVMGEGDDRSLVEAVVDDVVEALGLVAA